ncbi:RTA1-domain-containing protein [Stereum hirsutum FP-91666 SS1]|uniref:RTA1-domain-containing protein n=1 Tax=Stereum hirsutum (strain FP-91666) TaxID=721885 RepID=UPI000440DBEA|nr:RTA1-domain-containing protein [Stereum hirsutum FP-91666 SS1]EIM90022.1 RTA1-domain-containing protein [Stereum hirsutum FP-91666 SS1]
MSSNGATTPTEDELSQYGYIPTEWVCALFIALFGLSTLIHVLEAARSRLWWLFPTAVLAGLIECIGWSGRLWSSKNPIAGDPFLMQFIAANFIILGRLIALLGENYSRLSSKRYTQLFLTCDIIALVVQGTGGGIASSADDEAGTNAGGNIMLGGIVFQLVAIVVYACLAAEFFFRYFTDRPFRRAGSGNGSTDTIAAELKMPITQRMKLMILAMILMTTFLLIRSVYRTIELADGWNGTVITTQVYFNVFDGAMITLAMYTLNIFHPGFLLPQPTLTQKKTASEVPLSSFNYQAV